METIQSKDNYLIKDIKKLKEKKHRTQSCKFLIEGFRFVCEGLESDFDVPLVFISENAKDRWESFDVQSKLQKETKVYSVTDQILRSISSTDTPQGIVAVVNNKSINVENKQGFYILADKVQDPGNMGTIIRTAHAAGALGVIITKGTVDIYNEKTLRSTMGSIFHIPVIQDDNLSQLDFLKNNGFKLVVSSLDTDNNFFDVDLRNKSIIAVGNEGNGISKELLDISDVKIKIPMPGGAESLNVSIAASVMMFEVVRQNLS